MTQLHIQFLEEKSKLKDVVTLPSGLRYKVLKKGTGWRNGHPKVHTQCAAHYSTNHIDGTEIESTLTFCFYEFLRRLQYKIAGLIHFLGTNQLARSVRHSFWQGAPYSFISPHHDTPST